jgi:hypothetical protein
MPDATLEQPRTVMLCSQMAGPAYTYPDGDGATMEGKIMRKMIMALILSAAFIMSGISVTTFSTGQLTMTTWANGAD